jgi:Uncharacterized protein conserved in bacteria
MKLTENFELAEFESKDGAETPLGVLDNIKELAENLEIVRKTVKNPIRINSGYRSPAHNAKIGGAKNSLHLKGMAADIVIYDYDTEEVFATLNTMMQLGQIKKGGLKKYSTFVHYDIRGEIKRW